MSETMVQQPQHHWCHVKGTQISFWVRLQAATPLSLQANVLSFTYLLPHPPAPLQLPTTFQLFERFKQNLNITLNLEEKKTLLYFEFFIFPVFIYTSREGKNFLFQLDNLVFVVNSLSWRHIWAEDQEGSSVMANLVGKRATVINPFSKSYTLVFLSI